ncbi:uncharacterized protein CC84DRAFT_1087078 [Paraphaeosphaeria sporulosa]|uniref:Rhodanese domain-containing protein n=1 Tax=Paraphaeosphaeria sporulosa TaxID=1460663 RepID=A0A177CPK2_9PLEO|nr:uncharacterized protein CC84DRAFT_1087078 [Paraphaeosphaeria sporulosa]OAG08882.1 hypothetical protein CC84DRAFT_1087078 [Paraphaeosphaeria sporulosa]
MSEAPKTNWYDAFPAPKTTAALLSREAALASLSSSHLLVVDVRRTDYEGGTIRGSINLPAQSFYMNTAVLYDLCKRAGVKQVAFYCDYLAEKGETEIQSLTLAGGIKGWVKAGASFTQAVDSYDPEYWRQFDESK